MVKRLRSLIHEKFPPELRVKIELLSRRMDIQNNEKHEEFLKLLREYNVGDVIQLGPGTNRYAIKLDGFVIKVATDHDGKIDNFKEFKMAKRLYPYVTKIYEVSSNGTLLVAEYIQPFDSFAEMSKYADRIREILTKLSSVYLIGDVGITSKNYSNWGLRIGTHEPVCLDFAYVYDVSSELFLCRYCNTGAMLVPNRDFTHLQCPNPGCGKVYMFEDIRGLIGNDIHRHEIGDLSLEGYRLFESNVDMELDETRSNYLARKDEKSKKHKHKEDNTKDETINDRIDIPWVSYDQYYKEDNMRKMSVSANWNVPKDYSYNSEGRIVLNAISSRAMKDDEDDSSMIIGVARIDDDPTPSRGSLVDQILAKSGRSEEVIQREAEPIETVDDEEAEDERDYLIGTSTEPVKSNNNVELDITAPGITPDEFKQDDTDITNDSSEAEGVDSEYVGLSPKFREDIKNVISKFSNRFMKDLHKLELFDDIYPYMRNRKMLGGRFYEIIQNAVFNSLMNYLGIEKQIVNNYRNNGTHVEWKCPDEFNEDVMPTLIFLDRFWMTREINEIEDPILCRDKYEEIFEDYVGIQREWLPHLRKILQNKLPAEPAGIDEVVENIDDLWCVEVYDEEDEQETRAEESEEDINNEDEDVDNIQPGITISEPTVQATVETTEPQSEEDTGDDQDPDDDDYEMQINVIEKNNDHEPDNEDDEECHCCHPDIDDDEEDDDEDDHEKDPLCVYIYPESEQWDIVRVEHEDQYGVISIPLYAKLADITDDHINKYMDEYIGYWGWLKHMVPDMVFHTKNLDKWLKLNNSATIVDATLISVIGVREDGEYILGIHNLEAIYIMAEDNGEAVPIPTADPYTLAKLNALICMNLENTCMSNRAYVLDKPEVCHDEHYMDDFVNWANLERAQNEDDDEDDEEDNSDMNDEEMSAAERAAIAALNGGNVIPVDNAETSGSIKDMLSEDPVITGAEGDKVIAPDEQTIEMTVMEFGVKNRNAREYVQNSITDPVIEHPPVSNPQSESPTKLKPIFRTKPD